jgi:hypothetical protein
MPHHACSLTDSRPPRDDRRAASRRRRATLLITVSLTATLAVRPSRLRAEELPRSLVDRALHRAGFDRHESGHRRLAASLLPTLRMRAGAQRIDVPGGYAGWAFEAAATLSWPLERHRSVAADEREQRRMGVRKEQLLGRMADLWRHREALRQHTATAEKSLELEETDAELDALAGEGATREVLR